jgi:hypothetical protein
VTLYAIDPGTEESALLMIVNGRLYGAIKRNDDVIATLRPDEDLDPFEDGPCHLVVEQIESYGMAVGREVFQTVFWSGRFVESWTGRHGATWSMLPRRDVKITLCGSARAKDANIRQALIDRYGGKAATKKGGPLYGIKSHLWAALAVAETYKQQQREKELR